MAKQAGKTPRGCRDFAGSADPIRPNHGQTLERADRARVRVANIQTDPDTCRSDTARRDSRLGL